MAQLWCSLQCRIIDVVTDITAACTDQYLTCSCTIRVRQSGRWGDKSGIVKLGSQGVRYRPAKLKRGQVGVGMDQNGIIKAVDDFIGISSFFRFGRGGQNIADRSADERWAGQLVCGLQQSGELRLAECGGQKGITR